MSGIELAFMLQQKAIKADSEKIFAAGGTVEGTRCPICQRAIFGRSELEHNEQVELHTKEKHPKAYKRILQKIKDREAVS